MELSEAEQYEAAKTLCFNLMDPCDWAAELNQRLARATKRLKSARAKHNDLGKDFHESTESETATEVREAATEYLAGIHEMLHSMPILQQQPEILDSSRFIIASLEDVGQGRTVNWLEPKATKKHPMQMEKEAEWVPIIAALELLLFQTKVTSVDAAARQIHQRTGRAKGTIKDWHQKLYRNGRTERPNAWQNIEYEVTSMRAVLRALTGNLRQSTIERRVSELLDR